MPTSTLVRQDPDEPTKVPFEINRLIHHLTDAEIQTYMERDEILNKVAEEEMMSKPALIKVVYEEAEKIGFDTKELASGQAGAVYKKAQEEEMSALKKEREQKLRKDAQVRKTRIERYTWEMKERLKHESITEIQIHRNTNPVVFIVFRGPDQRVMCYTP